MQIALARVSTILLMVADWQTRRTGRGKRCGADNGTRLGHSGGVGKSIVPAGSGLEEFAEFRRVRTA